MSPRRRRRQQRSDDGKAQSRPAIAIPFSSIRQRSPVSERRGTDDQQAESYPRRSHHTIIILCGTSRGVWNPSPSAPGNGNGRDADSDLEARRGKSASRAERRQETQKIAQARRQILTGEAHQQTGRQRRYLDQRRCKPATLDLEKRALGKGLTPP